MTVIIGHLSRKTSKPAAVHTSTYDKNDYTQKYEMTHQTQTYVNVDTARYMYEVPTTIEQESYYSNAD